VHDVSGGRPLAWAAAAHGALARLHAEGQIDVASVPLWGSPGLFAIRDPRFPTVVSCMTSAATLGEIDPAWLDAPGGREALALERASVQGARHLHGLTRAALEKTIEDYGGEPLTADVVARGLRDRAAGSLREAGQAGDGPLEVLFVGRLEPRKGVDVLLDAMRALVAEGADVRLTLAGPDAELSGGGTYRERFEAASAGEIVGERVSFAGAVSDDRLHELYARADVVCQPSRYESHGIVLIEAMMFGRPIVTTSGGGIPEVVEPDGNALLAAPGDATSLARCLRAMLESPPLRDRMGHRSRELYATRFEIGVVARDMTALFETAARAHAETPVEPSAASMLAVALDERAAAAERRLQTWQTYAHDLEADRDAQRARAEAAEAQRDACEERCSDAERERDDWRTQTEVVNGRLFQVMTSRTWRYTQPLRDAARVTRTRW
jgi:hypothetical protein